MAQEVYSANERKGFIDFETRYEIERSKNRFTIKDAFYSTFLAISLFLSVEGQLKHNTSEIHLPETRIEYFVPTESSIHPGIFLSGENARKIDSLERVIAEMKSSSQKLITNGN